MVLTKMIVTLAVLCFQWSCIDAAKNYAVYFDPNNETEYRNPKGSGYTPMGPDNWDQVNYFQDFHDWEKYSEAELGNNVCSQGKLQSPLELGPSAWWTCNDRHEVRDWGGVGCEYDFRVTPYGLRADVKSCAKYPTEDLSRTTTPWELLSIVIKTPSEHTMNGRRYEGEFILQHRGTGIHSDRTTFVSIFLESSDETKNWELQKFIREWSYSQGKQYNDCGKYYDPIRCKARRIPDQRRNLRSSNNNTVIDDDEDDHDFDIDIDAALYYNFQDQTKERKLIREKYRPYHLIMDRTSDFYFGYEGSLTEPPCSEIVNWRILNTPMKVSKSHMEAINYLTAAHLDVSTCKLGTVGKPQSNDNCFVDVTRPARKETQIHHLIDCTEWVP